MRGGTCERPAAPWSIVSDYFLEREKKRRPSLLLIALDQPLRPALLVVQEIHGGDHVHEHPGREEVANPLGPGAGHALDVLDQLSEVSSNDLADLGVLARDMPLHLHAQLGRVLEQLVIRLADRRQSLLAALALGCPHERLDGHAEAAIDGCDEQLLLGAEEPEQV